MKVDEGERLLCCSTCYNVSKEPSAANLHMSRGLRGSYCCKVDAGVESSEAQTTEGRNRLLTTATSVLRHLKSKWYGQLERLPTAICPSYMSLWSSVVASQTPYQRWQSRLTHYWVHYSAQSLFCSTCASDLASNDSRLTASVTSNRLSLFEFAFTLRYRRIRHHTCPFGRCTRPQSPHARKLFSLVSVLSRSNLARLVDPVRTNARQFHLRHFALPGCDSRH